MKIIIISSLFVCVFSLFIINTPAQAATAINQHKILANAKGLKPKALRTAIKGYQWARKNGSVKKPNVLTIIDFNLPSYQKRLWVVDLKTSKMLMNTYTTHGKGSGLSYAKRFSNRARTDETSLGVYETLFSYHGKHGYSLRLKGLEKGVNSNALHRAIVVHPAYYASSQYIRSHHRAGRSWGCFGISPAISRRFVNLVKGGSVIYAFAKPMLNDPIIT